jgi:hypothetical protein
MTTINIESPLGLTQIEVVKNPFTDKFIPQITSMFADFPSKSFMVTYGGIMLKMSDNLIDVQLSRLEDAINELNALGTNFPYEFKSDLVKQRNTETQLYLNDLHRAFTTAHRSFYEGNTIWSDKFDSRVVLDPINNDRFLYLIDQINDMVHATELYVKTERKSNVVSTLVQQVEVGADTYVNAGTRLIKECFYTVDPNDYQYFSDSEDYDVWVGTSILGKDYLIAYYEHDRAGEWDVTHILGYSCKLAVDVSALKRSTVIKSAEFQQWLAEGGVTYTPAICGMPVGKVVAGKEFLSRYLKGNPVTDQLRVTINE